MLQEITIERFRGISRLEAKGLRDVNLILGRNNSGKTSFLEAVWLLCSGADPGAWLDMTALRSCRPMPLPDLLRRSAKDLDPLWRCCFHQMKLNEPIEFSSTYIREGGLARRSLRIAASVSMGQRNKSNDAVSKFSCTPSFISRLIFDQEDSGDRSRGEVWFENGRLRLHYEVDVEVGSFSFAMISAYCPLIGLPRVLQQAGERIYAKRKQLLDMLCPFDPALRDIVIRLENGKWEVYLDWKGSAQVPLSACGQGMLQLFVTVVELLNLNPPAVLLVDGIATDIHHSQREVFWRTLISLATEHQVQVFATVPSKEILHSAISQLQCCAPSRFGVFRIERGTKKALFVKAGPGAWDIEL